MFVKKLTNTARDGGEVLELEHRRGVRGVAAEREKKLTYPGKAASCRRYIQRKVVKSNGYNLR